MRQIRVTIEIVDNGYDLSSEVKKVEKGIHDSYTSTPISMEELSLILNETIDKLKGNK